MMNAKTVEQMREELEAAGYQVDSGSDNNGFTIYAQIIAPYRNNWYVNRQGLVGDVHSILNLETEKECLETALEMAWQHYQREKQHAEMKALLEELANDNSHEWEDDYKDEIYWRSAARRLLESMKG